MITLKMLTSREDLQKITGLPSDNYDEALWDAGFNLDNWDVCFVSNVPLTQFEDASVELYGFAKVVGLDKVIELVRNGGVK